MQWLALGGAVVLLAIFTGRGGELAAALNPSSAGGGGGGGGSDNSSTAKQLAQVASALSAAGLGGPSYAPSGASITQPLSPTVTAAAPTGVNVAGPELGLSGGGSVWAPIPTPQFTPPPSNWASSLLPTLTSVSQILTPPPPPPQPVYQTPKTGAF